MGELKKKYTKVKIRKEKIRLENSGIKMKIRILRKIQK